MLAKDILEEYIIECEIRKFSKRTLKQYRNNCSGFLRFIEGEFKITEINVIKTLHIKKYVRFLMNKNLSEVYINSIIKCLRSFFKYTFEEEYIDKKPTDAVKWQKESTRLINTFNDEEVKAMLKVFKHDTFLDSRNKCIISMLFDTGIRCSELVELQTVDIKGEYFTIIGKGDKERRIGISPYLQKELTLYQRKREYYLKDKFLNCDNYFLSRTCKPLTVEAVERIVKIAGIEANVREEIRCSPHTCRHYAAQKQLRNGLGVYELSRLLGHNKIEITKVYLQSLQDNDIVDLARKTSPLMSL